MLIISEQNDPHQIFLNRGFVWFYKVRECYSCLKMMIQAHSHVSFITIFFIKRASLKQFYIYVKLLQSSTIFKQKNHEVSYDLNFCIKFFTTPNSKNVISILRLVRREKSEFTFLLILYFHEYDYTTNYLPNQPIKNVKPIRLESFLMQILKLKTSH